MKIVELATTQKQLAKGVRVSSDFGHEKSMVRAKGTQVR